MNDPVVIALIGAFGGFISGIVASILAPWVNWGIKKRKEKLEERKKLLEDIRKIIIQEYQEFEKFNEDIALKKVDFQANPYYPKAITYLDTVNKHHQFHKIRPSLNQDTISILENSNLLELKDRGSQLGQLPNPYQKLMDNISQIEKQWNLI